MVKRKKIDFNLVAADDTASRRKYRSQYVRPLWPAKVGEMRQDPKIFYGREDAGDGIEDVISVPFTAHTLERSGVHVEGNDLWQMAENGWLILLDRPPQVTHKGRFLWYRRKDTHTMDIAELLRLLDAQKRLE